MNNPVDEVIKVCGMVQGGTLSPAVAIAALVSIGVPAAIAEVAVDGKKDVSTAPKGYRIAYSAGRYQAVGPGEWRGTIWLHEDLAVREAHLMAEQDVRNRVAIDTPA
jgi:hypothetical protein